MNALKTFPLRLLLPLSAFLCPSIGIAGISDASELFLKGEYTRALEETRLAEPEKADYASLAALEVRILLETGSVKEALERGLSVWPNATFDPELTLAIHEVLRANGHAMEAKSLIEGAIDRYETPPAMEDLAKPVAFAELLLAMNVDAKEVLKTYLEPAKEAFPDRREPYLAIGRLALRKHDRALAGEVYQEGLKRFANDPEFLLGMHLSGLELPLTQHIPDEGITSYLDLALEANPNFLDALLIKADAQLGSKRYAEAKSTLDEALDINAVSPETWARLAALAFLEEDSARATEALDNARIYWAENPDVPKIVGMSLAGHYRFAEAIPFLRRASQLDPMSASIRFELGSNQLRFGEFEEGWANVALAHEIDPFNVAAFNLVTLRDKIKDYPVLEKDGVMVRMSPEDSAVFGQRALDLAVNSKNVLAYKYGITLDQPVMVEMLPRQEDFAIRTLGLPGGESFLGVCFGPLITMTSPRGRLGRANWESVLWHEMAHTITLQATRHRIPRWLTEGISVHEERQVREGWGQGMTAAYRERFMSEEMPEIINLNESFQGPDILFGYYHASLVVDFLIERFGIERMRKMLADLSAGKSMETVLVNRTLPLDELESAFREYAKKKAEAYGTELDWTPLSDEEYLAFRDASQAWVADHPNRYSSTMMLLAQLLEAGQWAEAKALAEEVIAAEPNNREEYNPYWELSRACRGLSDEAGERAALVELLRLDSNASEAAARLLQLSPTLDADDRLANADRMLETNPFQEQAYRMLAQSAKEIEDAPRAKGAYRSLLGLDPLDSSRLHYELALMLQQSEPEKARREVLKALETNPRFELALELLVSLPPSP